MAKVADVFGDLYEASVKALDQLKANNAELQDFIGERDQRIAGLDQHVADLNESVLQREQEIARLKSVVDSAQLAAAHTSAQLSSVYASSSWRLTTPLRRLGRIARKLLSLSRGDAAQRAVTAGAPGDKPPGIDATSTTRKLQAIAAAYDGYWNDANNTRTAVLNSQLTETPVRADRCDVKLIAYYLPQFHPIPENDAWWGRGFTEWRNVTKAVPAFAGHLQPKLPGELGFYDLRVVDTIRRQAELARLYGISAFCFHFYWFGGKRLLEAPLLSFLDHPDIDIEFCLCWANENWTRKWNGRDDDVLIPQTSSPEDDIAFIRYIKKYFDDPRYLRIEDKPVLTIYRPASLPDASATIGRWRAEARAMGFPGLYLVATNSFDFADAQAIGVDALSEFPPHGVTAARLKIQRLADEFSGRVYSYPDLLTAPDKAGPQEISLWPGVMPGWDNTARQPKTGKVFQGSTSELFHKWLSKSIDRARRESAGRALRRHQCVERMG